MAIHVSSYEGGMDRDSSKNKYPKGSYYKMKNFRLISFDELSNGAVSSIKGNTPITITGSTNTDDIIIGYCIIRNYLVVWSTNCHDTTGGRGTIWRTDLSVTNPAWFKVYESSSMMLTTQYPIFEETIGYYEDSDTIKVYWTDNFNMIRFVNIMETFAGPVNKLNILPNVVLTTPTIKNIGAGNIYVGKIQYAFQYYNIGGNETVFSPCTPLIPLTKSSEGLTGANIRLYEGSPVLDEDGNPNNSGKSVTIEIGTVDSNYEKLRIVAILYRNLDQIPDIHVVGEYNTVNNLMVTDYGDYTKGILTLNAFRTLGNHELYCKTISQKGNKVLIGNITEKYFDFTFDARAYRFRKAFNAGLSDTDTSDGKSASYGDGGITIEKISNTVVQITIANYPTFFSVDVNRTITDIITISSTVTTSDIIGGVWEDIFNDYHTFGATLAESTISIVSHIGTTLVFRVTQVTGDPPFFNDEFDHFENNTGFSGITIEYSFITSVIVTSELNVYNSETLGEDEIVKSPGLWPTATYTINGSNVPEDHDCICPYNYDFLYSGGATIDEAATYDPGTVNSYKYQSDLSTLGGEGPNVKYKFLTDVPILIDKSSDTRYDQPDIVTIENLTSYDSYKNPLRTVSLMNYKHDEVYRHALEFTNTKGQDSFVKWVADIKTPTPSELPTVQSTITRETEAYPLGIEFTINTTGLVAQGIIGVRIVRVERKKEDRTIYSQGIISSMFSHPITMYNRITNLTRATVKIPTVGVGSATKAPTCYQFISPEISYFKDLSPTTDHYYKTQGKLKRYSFITAIHVSDGGEHSIDVLGENEETTVIYSGLHYDDLFNASPISTVFKYYSRYYHLDALTTLQNIKLVEGTVAGIVECAGEENNEITFATASAPLLNRSYDYFGLDRIHEGISGTSLISIIESTFDISELTSTDDYELFLVDYKNPGIGASQYGGLTYESRQVNTYIESGPYTAISSNTTTIRDFGGDTTISFYEHLKTMWEVDNNEGNTNADVEKQNRCFSVLFIPVESVINSDLSNGIKYSKYYNSTEISGIREVAGTYYYGMDTVFTDNAQFIQEKNMYEYNSVYSQQNSTKVYFAKPDNWDSIVHDDTLVKISEEKVPREEVDSYLKFLTDNEKLLSTQYGPINDLFLFKNYMMVFMDHAFGTLSIDERALLPIQNNSILELGAANNLQYFDFISDRSGSIHPSSINRMGNGFGWFDANLNSFGYYNGETQDIGLVKGMSSEFKRYSDLIKLDGVFSNNQFYGGNFLTFENRKFKESYCAMIVSELAIYNTKDSTSVTFTLTHSPGNYLSTEVVINGIEYYADVTRTESGPGDNGWVEVLYGAGTLTINTTDNPTLNVNLYTTGKYYIYYKDLSKVISFSSVNNAFQFEVDIFPQHLIEYKEDLFDIFYKMQIYKENEGNYGEFYGIYRNGEIEYLVNPQQSLICVFNNFEYAMEGINTNGNELVWLTWNSLRTFNDYQYSVGMPTLCTFVDTGDMFNTTLGHGLLLNDEIMFSGNIPTGLSTSTIYYIINPTVTTFNISETRGGSIKTFTGVGNCYFHLLDAPLVIDTPFDTPAIDGNIKRRMRGWRIADLRDRQTGKPRMRDSYIRLLFKINHGKNNRIVMHDLYTYYSITRESMMNSK